MRITLCVERQYKRVSTPSTPSTPSSETGRRYAIAQRIRIKDQPGATWVVIDYSVPPIHLRIPAGTGPLYRLHTVIHGRDYTCYRHESRLRPVPASRKW